MNRGTGNPVPVAQIQQLLFVLRSADMAVTTDQIMVKVFAGSKYIITNMYGTRVSGAYNTACLGGLYTAASKAGNALVASTQTWAALTGASTVQTATLAAIAGTSVSTATPYLSLTTGNGAALSADIFLFGVCVD